MADEIRTKAQLLALFADNVTQNISPQDVRDFVLSNNVQLVQTETAPAILVDETDFFLADPGCTDLQLTQLAGYGDRSLSVSNASGGDLVLAAAPFETLGGELTLTLPDGAFAIIGSEAAGTDWQILLNTGNATFISLRDTPADYTGQANKHVVVNGTEDGLDFAGNPPRLINILFNHIGNLMGGAYLDCGQVTMDGADRGWVAPIAGTMTEIGFGMNAPQASLIHINVNNVVQGTLAISGSKHTFSVSIPFVLGDVITLQNDNAGSTLNNVILNALIEV